MERINPYLNNIAYYLVLVFAFVLMLSNALAATLAGAIFLIWMAQALAYRRKAWLKFPLFKPICALIGFKLIVIIVMGYHGKFGQVFGQLAFPLIYFTLPAIVVTAERRRRVLWMIISGAILAGGIGIIKYILGMEPRISSLVAGPFTLGAFMTIVFSLVVSMLIYAKTLRERFFTSLISIPIILAIILSYVRSAYLAVVTIIVSMGIFKLRKLLLIFGIVILCIVYFSPDIKDKIINRFNPQAADILSDRDFLFKEAISKSTTLGFFGYGVNSFSSFPEVIEYNTIKMMRIGNCHNMYLEPLLDGGPILAFIILSIFVIQIQFSRAIHKKTKDYDQKTFQLGVLLAILSILIVGLFSDPLKDPILTMTIWLLFGLSLI